MIKSIREMPYLSREKITLSTLLGISEQNILCHFGSPHNDVFTLRWIEEFFDSLDIKMIEENYQREEVDILLMVFKKPEDSKFYLNKNIECHYIDLIFNYYKGHRPIHLWDITQDLNSDEFNQSSSVLMGWHIEELANHLPAVSLAAKLLKESGSMPLSAFRTKIKEIQNLYGFDRYSVSELKNALTLNQSF